MATNPLRSAAAHDDQNFHYDLSNAIYGQFPSCATDILPRRSRASSPTPNSSRKRKPIITISLNRNNATPTWLPQPKQRSPLGRGQNMSIHQSTCLNLNMASEDSSESDLWILPELDDWEEEAETESETLSPSASASESAPRPTAEGEGQGKWALVLRRAANSNLERLRTRLEGDGWDFVGGRYGDETKTLQKAANQDDESLDEEFDVVVLSTAQTSG